MFASDFTTLFAYGIALVTLVAGLSIYIKIRAAWNGHLEVAIDNFDRAANSLLKTPRDLPAEALMLIEMMNNLATSRKAPAILRNTIRADRKGTLPKGADEKTHAAWASMRPELRDLMMEMLVAWMNIMTSRQVITGLLVHYELYRLKIERRQLSGVEAREKFSVVSSAVMKTA